MIPRVEYQWDMNFAHCDDGNLIVCGRLLGGDGASVNNLYILHQAITAIAHRAKKTLVKRTFELALEPAQAHFQTAVTVSILFDADNKFLLAAYPLIAARQRLNEQ